MEGMSCSSTRNTEYQICIRKYSKFCYYTLAMQKFTLLTHSHGTRYGALGVQPEVVVL